VLATFAYDARQRRLTLTRGNGVVTRYGWDGHSRLAGIEHDLAGASQDGGASVAYTNDGRIKARAQFGASLWGWAGPAASGSAAWSADRLDRYTHLPVDPPPNAANYSPAGELVRNEGNGYAFAYDVEGKLRIADNGVAFRLIDYDPLGRIRRVGPDGATLVHAGAQLMAEYDGATLARRHVFAPGLDEPLVSYSGATRTWLLADERGSVVAETDGAGVATASFGYGPHGEPDSRGLPTRFGFTGAPILAPLALTQMRTRTYSHNLGRFLQTDPIGQAGGINLYDYAGGDPVNGWDPFGLGPIVSNGQTVAICGTGCRPGDGGAFSLTAPRRSSRSRWSVVATPSPYGGWHNREWEWEQIYGDGKGGPESEMALPAQEDRRDRRCASNLYRFGEALEEGGEAGTLFGLGAAVAGVAAGGVTAGPGIVGAQLGGVTSAVGQAFQDSAFNRPVWEIGVRAAFGFLGGRVAVAVVPRGLRSDLGDSLFGYGFNKALGKGINAIDPDWCK
jgi:RHS repeat-associated protein